MGKKIEVTRDGAIFELIDEDSLASYKEKGYNKVTPKKKSSKTSTTEEETK
jgi:hypothetical protein